MNTDRTRCHDRMSAIGLLVTLGLLVLLTGCTRPHQFNGTAFEKPAPAFPFEGLNYDGQPFRMGEQQGKVVVVFFGYTFCPDVCPLTLADLKQVVEQLGEKAEQLAVVFVTIDPERDTLAQLATYVNAFNPAFYGVRLEGQMYETTKAAYGVFAEKNTSASSDPDNYFMDHSGAIYVIDKGGNLSEALRYDAGVDAIRSDLEYWLGQ